MHIKRWNILVTLVQNHEWTKGVEVGVLNGATFFHLLDKVPDLTMIGVDRWAEDAAHYGDIRVMGEAVKAQAKDYGKRAEILHGSSVEMAQQVRDKSVDFVFIDADHDYECVKEDIETWLPKIKPSGWLIGHDWNMEFPGVIQAVTEKFGKPYTFADHVWGVPVGKNNAA